MVDFFHLSCAHFMPVPTSNKYNTIINIEYSSDIIKHTSEQIQDNASISCGGTVVSRLVHSSLDRAVRV